MKMLLALIVLCSVSFAHAEEKMKMYFNNEDVAKIIEQYSKASGQKFIVDSNVRGKVSIFVQEPVTLTEAFNHLSSALAINSYGISKQGDTMTVRNARNIQRDFIEVGTAVPALKPERMYSWIYTVKNIPADHITRDLRLLTSRDGEMSSNYGTNQLVITDWVSNIHRIAETLKQVDIKVDSATAKIVDAYNKERAARKAEKFATEEKTKTAN